MKFNIPESIHKDRQEIIKSILSSVISNNSGECLSEVKEAKPSRKFFIGTLSPRPTKEELINFTNKVSPPTIGLEFLIEKDFSKESKILMLPKGFFYYRVFPDFEEQKEYSKKATSEGAKSSPFMEKFKKLPITINPLSIEIDEIISESKSKGVIFKSLKKECEKLWARACKDPRFYLRKNKSKSKWPRIPLEELKNEETYNDFITKNRANPSTCPWDMGLNIEVFETENGHRFIISYSNMSEVNDDPIIENTIFGASLKIELIGEKLKKFKLDNLLENYRHDRLIESSGINCSTESIGDNILETIHTPIFFERRRIPVDCNTDLTFDTLSKNPSDSLEKLGDFLKDRLDSFKTRYGNVIETEAEKESFESDIKMAERELERFNTGLKLLKKEKILRAFKLTNKSFLYASNAVKDKKFNSWYPFQITFLVSLIPDIIQPYENLDNHYRDFVDLLYFPTGGGKTEAFLGLAVFQAFIDRIEGKKFGVSAITKFPLRMLSLQQLQRIANIFAQAELVREKEKDMFEAECEFSVGYFVGEASTPNQLIKYDNMKGKYFDFLDELDKDKNQLEKYQIVMECPFCHNRSVDLKVDKDKRRIIHFCNSQECKRELPIYISDSEIYRYLPTFIVSTLDKLASVGLQKNLRNILGGIKYKCPKHGFSSTQKCIEYGSKSFEVCKTKADEMEAIPKGDYSPSLIIQDEMHLIRDSWGTFNSHYETLIDKIISEQSGNDKSVKKIAATATISPSTYRNHVNDLYVREPILFPSNLELFTNESEEISRVIVGLMPHNKTQINAIEEVIGSIAVNTQQSITDSSFPKKESRDFWTILSYHNKRNDAYQMGRSIGTRINENMIKPFNNLKMLKKETLTGEVSFKEIRSIMDSIENESNFNNTIDTLIATSIISHGVDISTLNIMTFMGMPSNNAEYIQALSRIGRRSTGIAFVVFNPTRERDQSYFKYFIKFNELRDLLIESIPICRWSEKAIERTCPGLFMGSLLCHFDFIVRSKGMYGDLRFAEPLRNVLNDKVLNDEDFQDFIKECYRVDKCERREEISKLIDENVSRHLNSIIICGHEEKRKFIGMILNPRPLMSLRDIDASVQVTLTTDTHAALKSGKIYSTREGGE